MFSFDRSLVVGRGLVGGVKQATLWAWLEVEKWRVANQDLEFPKKNYEKSHHILNTYAKECTKIQSNVKKIQCLQWPKSCLKWAHTFRILDMQ